MTDLNPQELPAGQPQFDRELNRDYDPSTSIGASINESMMMPTEALATQVPDLEETLGDIPSLSVGEMGLEDTMDDMKTLWQKQVKVMEEKIRVNPYPYVAGALGLGLLLGRRLAR